MSRSLLINVACIWREERRLTLCSHPLLFLPFELLNGLWRCRKLLWRRAAMLDDELAYVGAHLVMRAVGGVFAR